MTREELEAKVEKYKKLMEETDRNSFKYLHYRNAYKEYKEMLDRLDNEMTIEEAEEYFHALTNDIEKYGAKKVLKADNYFFWNDSDSKQKALKIIEDYYAGEMAYADRVYKNDKEEHDFATGLLQDFRFDDIKDVENAGGNDVIIINLEEADWGKGVVTVMDYKFAMKELDWALNE